jgi:hypothetical protein
VIWSGLEYTTVLSFSNGEAVKRRATRTVPTFALGAAAAFNLNAFRNCGMPITSTMTKLHVRAACSLVTAIATVPAVRVAFAVSVPAAPATPDTRTAPAPPAWDNIVAETLACASTPAPDTTSAPCQNAVACVCGCGSPGSPTGACGSG